MTGVHITLNTTDDGLKTRLDTLETATLPPKCVPPGGKYLQFNGTNWLCVCEPNWTGDTCEVSPSPPPPTWTEISTGRGTGTDWYSVTSSSDGTKLAATAFHYGHIWTSTDSGATWTEHVFTGPGKWWTSITSSSDGTKLTAVVSGGNIWTTRYDV